jgi:hypothetical protein
MQRPAGRSVPHRVAAQQLADAGRAIETRQEAAIDGRRPNEAALPLFAAATIEALTACSDSESTPSASSWKATATPQSTSAAAPYDGLVAAIGGEFTSPGFD